MLPLRPSFLLALFPFLLCRALVPSTNSSSSSLSISPNAHLQTSSSSFSSSSSSSSSAHAASSTSFSASSIRSSSSSTTSSDTATSTTPTAPSTTSSSTTSTSTSSSSSQSLTSSSSTSSLPSSPTSFDVIPATTLIVPDPSSLTTLTSSSDDAGPTNDVSSTSAAASTPFWDNKSAVAGTFITVGLAALVLVGVVAYVVFHRRQRRKLERAMEAEDFVGQNDIDDPYDVHPSPAPSLSQVTMPTRAEAIVSRDVHFGPNYAYGLDYAPSPLNASRIGLELMYPVLPRPGVDPSRIYNNRQTPGRESVATYDSFYGGIERGHAI